MNSIRFFKILLLLLAVFLLAACQERDEPTTSHSGPLPDGAAARLGKGQITDLAFAPGGDALYAGSKVGLARYDAQSPAERWQEPTASAVRDVAASPDGKQLLVGLEDGTVQLLDSERGDLIERWPGYAADIGVSALAWQNGEQADGVLAVAGFDDGNLLLIRVKGEEVETMGGLPRQRSGIRALAFNPDGRILATGNNSGDLYLIDIGSQILLATLIGHEPGKAIGEIVWSPDGAEMASGSKDGVVIEWDMSDLSPAQIWPAEESAILSLGYFADGDRLALAVDGGQLEQWQVGQTVDGTRKDTGSPLLAAAWDGKSGRYATAGEDGMVRLWSLPGSGEWPEEAILSLPGYAPNAQEALVVAFDPSGRSLLSSLGAEAIVWDMAGGERRVNYGGHEAAISAAAWSPSGDQVASGDRDGRIHIWRTDNGELVQTLDHHTRPVGGLSWSPDGSMLASTGSLADELIIWDAASGAILHELAGEGDGLWAAAWSPDGSRLAAGSTGGKLFIWETADFDAPQGFQRHQTWISDIEWFGDSKRLITGGGDSLAILWDIEQRNSSLLPGHSAPVRGVALSPDGARAASIDVGGAIIIWDTDPRAQEQMLDVLAGHTSGGTAVDWSPDGKQIATAGEDGTVLIWDAGSEISE